MVTHLELPTLGVLCYRATSCCRGCGWLWIDWLCGGFLRFFGHADFFPQRARAALADICERLRALSLAARALPPLRPPRRPKATAAGFLMRSAGGSYLGACPVDSSMI